MFALMKRIKFVILFCFYLGFFSFSIGATPSNVRFSAYAVEDYSNYTGTKNLARSISHKNKFLNKLIVAIQKKYPNVSTEILYNRENSQATSSAFKLDKTDSTEIVFFAGHGNQQSLAFYDKSLSLDKGNKTFGKKTRWVFFDACLVLNVNKSGHLSEAMSAVSVDANRLTKMVNLFEGVHAILGNYGLDWQGNIKKHWYSSARWRTEDVYEYFAKYFIEDGVSLWNAYSSSVKKVYNNFHNNAALGYSTGISGYDSAIWYFYGVEANGNVVDMSEERFDFSYNAPVLLNDTRFKSKSLKLRRLKIGKPKYE